MNRADNDETKMFFHKTGAVSGNHMEKLRSAKFCWPKAGAG